MKWELRSSSYKHIKFSGNQLIIDLVTKKVNKWIATDYPEILKDKIKMEV